MGNARGSGAQTAASFETTYGVASVGTYTKLGFVSNDLDGEVALIDNDLLGQGRDASDPGYDVMDVRGQVVFPLCARQLGYALKALMGAPVTTAEDAASGALVFSAQPAAASTITLNGTVWTFVASGASGNQVNIGANLAATLTALASALNASAETQTAKNTYTASATTLTITHDTLGLGGNAFTLAASVSSNATPSADTLTNGTVKHTFTSGAATLPSMTIENGNPEVPSYTQNLGAQANSGQIDFKRGGWINLVVQFIAQKYVDSASSVAGVPTVLPVQRMSNLTGSIKRNGVALGKVVGGSLTYSNNLDPQDEIRDDGAIGGCDLGTATANIQVRTRFADRVMLDQATNRLPCELEFGWSYNAYAKVSFTFHRVFVPKPKKPIEGQGGLTLTFDGRGAKDPTLNKMATVALINDIAGY